MTTERMEFIREVRPNTVRIQLHKKIGQGLSSHVFEGVRIDSRGHTSQSVAVKITKTQEDVVGLKREFETLLQVQSAHLVKVFAWDNVGDESMLSMELIDGVSLAQIFESDALDSSLIEEIVTQIQKGLLALHSKGLQHGDISLNNVLITQEGVVKLIDFANPDRTHNFVHGTPPYVAPEVWAGSAHTISSDLFALGMVRKDLHSRLADSTYQPPCSVEAARQRCFKMIKEQNSVGWLSQDPSERFFTERLSSAYLQKQLAELVRDLKQSVGSDSANGAVSENSTLGSDEIFWPRSFHPPSANLSAIPKRLREKVYSLVAASLVALLLMSGCWVDQSRETADRAPRGASSKVPTLLRVGEPRVNSKLTDGRLSIRSHRWMHFSLGEQALGYAPLRLSKLRPGRYSLKWQTHSAQGVKTIEIRQGRETTLQDSDF